MMADLEFDSPLDIPPLDDFAFPADLDSVQAFDLAFVFDGLDDEPPRFGKGKDMEKLRRCHEEEQQQQASSDGEHCPKDSHTPPPPPPPHSSSSSHRPTQTNDCPHRQNWDDEARMEASKRKLREGYEEEQRKKHRIQVIDIKSIPMLKPQRGGRVVNRTTKTFRSSRRCLAF